MCKSVNRTIAGAVVAVSLALAPVAHAAGDEPSGGQTPPWGALNGESVLIGGTVTAISGSTITLDVQRGNAAGRQYVGHVVLVDVSAARFSVRDTDKDGAVGLDEVAVNDRLAVGGGAQTAGTSSSAIKADVVVDPGQERPVGGGGASPVPEICRLVDTPAAQERLSVDQRDAIQAACQALKVELMNAIRDYQSTVGTLRSMLQAARGQAQTTCRQSGYDSDACRQARQALMATVDGLRAKLESVRASERSALQTALQRFREAVTAVLHGSPAGSANSSGEAPPQ